MTARARVHHKRPDGPSQRTVHVRGKSDVVVAAARLFMEKGITNVKMTDIAEASGIGVATVYRHYSTKNRVALAAGTFLWTDFNSQITDLVESDDFLRMDGATRLERMFRLYSTNYVENASFVRFIDELDHLVSSGGVSQEDLEAYGEEVDSFYLIFEDAYQLGRQDGSVRREVDFPVFYRSVAHALIGVAQKLYGGEVIPSDDFSRGTEELECIVDMAVRSLR